MEIILGLILQSSGKGGGPLVSFPDKQWRFSDKSSSGKGLGKPGMDSGSTSLGMGNTFLGTFNVMLYQETVEPKTLDLILRLQKDELFKEFALAGSVALSLQIGHRLATDIDLCGENSFDASLLSGHLSGKYRAGNIQATKSKISCILEGVSVDLQSHPSPWLQPLLIVEDMRMLSLEDLGAMKLDSLVNRGSRFTDWVDLYKLLEQETLEQLIEDYEKKYPGVKRLVAQKVLLPPDELVPEPVGFVGEEVTIQDIAYRLKKAIKEPKRIFESVPWRQAKTKKTSQSPDKSRGKGMR